MKTFRTIQKIAVAIGLCYGVWISNKVDAGSGDIATGLVIVALSIVIAIGLAIMPMRGEGA